MRQSLLDQIKYEMEKNLTAYLREEGIELRIAANDNAVGPADETHVELESIRDTALEGASLLTEIRVALRVIGKPWHCDALVNGIYHALQPHYITLPELNVILMSLHVETLPRLQPRSARKRAVMRYIIETSYESETL